MKLPVLGLVGEKLSIKKRQNIRLLPSFVGYSLLIACAVLAVLLLQYQYWRGEFGYFQLEELKSQVRRQEAINKRQEYINHALQADISDLKFGTSAIEEHARMDLGFIKPGETFVQVSVASSVVYDDEPSADTSVANEPIDEDTLTDDKPEN